MKKLTASYTSIIGNSVKMLSLLLTEKEIIVYLLLHKTTTSVMKISNSSDRQEYENSVVNKARTNCGRCI